MSIKDGIEIVARTIKRFVFAPFYKKFDDLRKTIQETQEQINMLANRQVIDFLTLDNKIETDAAIRNEKKAIIKYITSHLNTRTVFPYTFTEKYSMHRVQVFHDDSCGMKYVIFQNKRMYFPVNWNEIVIKTYFTQLQIEQDEESPHHYLTDTF